MGKNDSENTLSDGTTDAHLSLSDRCLTDDEEDEESMSDEELSTSDDEFSDSDQPAERDIEEQLCTLEQERQKILKKLKKFELEKRRKKLKKQLKKAKERKKKKKKLKRKKSKTRKKKRKKSRSSSSSSSSSGSSSTTDTESETQKSRRRRKKKKQRRQSSSSSCSSSSNSSECSSELELKIKPKQYREMATDSPIVIQESETESSVDEAPINPQLGSRLGPSAANATLLDAMDAKMSNPEPRQEHSSSVPKQSPIEKFHQERSDQDIMGRVIKGRKIVVKAKQQFGVQVISSGQSSPQTNPNSPQPPPLPPLPREPSLPPLSTPPMNSPLLNQRFGDSNRREDRKLSLLNPLLRKAKFYIIKSVFDENIDLSQEKGVWATLPHNEKKFNHAFSDVDNVFFFFIVNQSQRFRGFARMRAPAKRNTEEISWKLPDKMKAHGFSFGEVIKLDWISSHSVPFERVRDLRNQLNKNNPVWAGRDGQEIDPEAGRDLSLSFSINRDINEIVINNFKLYTQEARLEYAEQSRLKREAATRKRAERYNNVLAEVSSSGEVGLVTNAKRARLSSREMTGNGETAQEQQKLQ